MEEGMSSSLADGCSHGLLLPILLSSFPLLPRVVCFPGKVAEVWDVTLIQAEFSNLREIHDKVKCARLGFVLLFSKTVLEGNWEMAR